MDLTNYAVASGLLTFFVIGATELVKQAFARNWKSVVIIIVSALVGALGGLVLPVLGWIIGLALGLASSGLVTTVQKVGEGTVSLPPATPRV
jgi:uncharacterized protein involved in cysteine biosynthesis